VDFRLVLADGSLVMASACENEDLFWALRGGAGGGAWGVVCHVSYRLHPLVPVTTTTFFLQGIENAASVIDVLKFLELWLKFWVEKSPTLDNRFGGRSNSIGAQLIFVGSREEANAAF
jgi:FAD/FMN-containing dehydrogenase